MLTIEDIVFKLLPMVFAMGGTYMAIRADIKYLREKITQTDRDISRVDHSATKAHERIDDHVTAYHRRNT